ncbi:MAG: hypothetical protein ABSF10_01375 [Verrucomicrobiota bacterium]
MKRPPPLFHDAGGTSWASDSETDSILSAHGMTAKDQSDAKEMKPTVYIETTIPSLLTAWPNRDVEILAQQVATREWWEKRRKAFDLYISQEVLKEAARGDAGAARDRLSRRWPSAEFLPPPTRPRR